VIDAHRGPATVAGYTVRHGRDGVATGAVLVCDVDSHGDGDGGTGARCYAAVRDPDLLADLEAEEWVGRTVVLSDGGDGVNLATGEGPPA
jgi:acetyl-CoA C-acetyltransferase